MTSREEIEAIIPHRDPFLFVDRVVESEEDALVAEWTVPGKAHWFEGHYPGNPVMPGVLLCEHVFQTAAVFIARRNASRAEEAFDDGVPVLTKIESARFRRIVAPGETLRTRVSLRELLGPVFYMTGRITCGDERVLDVRFALSQSGAMQRLSESMG